jgi:hypothetical protein
MYCPETLRAYVRKSGSLRPLWAAVKEGHSFMEAKGNCRTLGCDKVEL